MKGFKIMAKTAKVEMIAVQSSNAEAVGYDSNKKELFVRFKGGSTYRYSNVPKVIFDGLLQTESFGRYLNQKVKGKYNFKKIGS